MDPDAFHLAEWLANPITVDLLAKLEDDYKKSIECATAIAHSSSHFESARIHLLKAATTKEIIHYAKRSK